MKKTMLFIVDIDDDFYNDNVLKNKPDIKDLNDVLTSNKKYAKDAFHIKGIVREPYELNFMRDDDQIYMVNGTTIRNPANIDDVVTKFKNNKINKPELVFDNLHVQGNMIEKEQVNHPDHYNSMSVEVIDMMHRIWGCRKMVDFCEITAFKYLMRAGRKLNMLEDIEKANWYMDKAKHYQALVDEYDKKK